MVTLLGVCRFQRTTSATCIPHSLDEAVVAVGTRDHCYSIATRKWYLDLTNYGDQSVCSATWPQGPLDALARRTRLLLYKTRSCNRLFTKSLDTNIYIYIYSGIKPIVKCEAVEFLLMYISFYVRFLLYLHHPHPRHYLLPHFNCLAYHY